MVSEPFIDVDFTRVDSGGIITQISGIKEKTAYREHKIMMKVEFRGICWGFEYKDVINWDSDVCSLVKLAKERDVKLANLKDLVGEDIYLYRKEDSSSWLFKTKDPNKMFEEDSIIQEHEETAEKTMKSVSNRDSEDDSIESECLKYRTIGEYFVCEMTDMNEIERKNRLNLIEIVVDTPYDEGLWRFKKPYDWSNDNPLVRLAEKRGYGQGNFTEVVGDDVLVKRSDDEWSLSLKDPNSHNPVQQEAKRSEKESIIGRSNILSFLGVLTY